AHARRLAIADTSQHAPHALERAPDVVDGSLVAREEREELHGNDGAMTREVLDDALVGDRARRHPAEIAQLSLDGLAAVTAQWRVGDDEAQPVVDVQHANGPGPGQATRSACPRRRAARAQQAVDAGAGAVPVRHRRARI